MKIRFFIYKLVQIIINFRHKDAPNNIAVSLFRNPMTMRAGSTDFKSMTKRTSAFKMIKTTEMLLP